MTILFFLIALGVLIFVHEFGHFILAKRQNVKVEEFSFGFGPRLFGIKRGETDYRVSALPLGGYVKMTGEDETDEKTKDDPRSFANKSVWQRTKIVVFGPLMNLIFALAVMPVVFFIGRAEPIFLREAPVVKQVLADSPAAGADFKEGDLIVEVGGTGVATWEDVMNKIIVSPGNNLKLTLKRGTDLIDKDVLVAQMTDLRGGYVGIEPIFYLGNEALIGSVTGGSPAAKAGMQAGDHVVELNGLPVKNWIDLLQKIKGTEGKKTVIKVKRGEEFLTMGIEPIYDNELKRWRIGVIQGSLGVPMETVRYGPADAIVKGTKENFKLVKLSFEVLGRLFTGGLSYKVLGGPVLIAKASAAAAASGLSNFLYFLAFLSLQLSIINLFPVPVLDGGHLLFLGIEAVRRKPLSVRVRQYATQAGFFILIAFMLLVTWNDLENIFGIKTLIKKLF